MKKLNFLKDYGGMLNDQFQVPAQGTIESLRVVMRRDYDREMRIKFPSYYDQFPDSFREAVIQDVFETSAWQTDDMYSLEDIRLAIQRVVLKAVRGEI